MPAKPKKQIPQTPDEKAEKFKDAEMPDENKSTNIPLPSGNLNLDGLPLKFQPYGPVDPNDYEKQRGKKLCPSCHWVIAARSATCPNCNHEFEKKEKAGKTESVQTPKPPKKTSSEKMLGLLSGQGINAELTMRFENGEIVTALKIDGKGSKLKWIGEDPGLIGNGEVLLHISDSPNGSQARVSLPLADFIKML